MNSGQLKSLQGDDAAAYVTAECLEGVSDENLVKRTYLKNLKPSSGIEKNASSIISKCWWSMMRSLKSSGISYACLLSSTVLACVLVSLTYNDVLEVNYGWPASNVGLINIGGVISALLGMLHAG
jgi:hypothetical protein